MRSRFVHAACAILLSTSACDRATAEGSAFDGGGQAACASTPAPPDPLGFSPLLGSGQRAGTITKAAPRSLSIGLDYGSEVAFDWAGPDLLYFSAGEHVTLDVDGFWQVVTGSRATAAVLVSEHGFARQPLAPVPGGPSLTQADDCSVEGQDTPSHCPPPTALGLTASQGAESVYIAPGATGSLGAWRITNVYDQESRGCSSHGHVLEGGWFAELTALETL